jgi:hypothetical protein
MSDPLSRPCSLADPIRENYSILQLSFLSWFYSTWVCEWARKRCQAQRTTSTHTVHKPFLCPLDVGPLPHRQISISWVPRSPCSSLPVPNETRVLPTNPSLGTLLLTHHHHPFPAPAHFMPTAIVDLDKPVAGATTPHAASRHRIPLIHPAYGAPCARHLSFRNARTYREDLNALILGMAALLFIMT